MKNSVTFVILLSFVVLCCKTKQLPEKVIIQTENKELNYIPYYIKVYEADSLYLVNNFEGSFELLDNLFKEYEPLNTERYKEYETYLSCCYKLKKNIDLRKLFEKSITYY